MKKLSLILPLLGFYGLAISVSAEEKQIAELEVPKLVRDAFHKAYPDARDIKYEAETEAGKPVYEIEFKDQGKEREASYTPDGMLLEIEEEIAISELPGPILQGVNTAYPNAVADEAEKILKPDGTVSGYEVEIKDGKRERELLLDPTGKILKAEAEGEDGQND